MHLADGERSVRVHEPPIDAATASRVTFDRLTSHTRISRRRRVRSGSLPRRCRPCRTASPRIPGDDLLGRIRRTTTRYSIRQTTRLQRLSEGGKANGESIKPAAEDSDHGVLCGSSYHRASLPSFCFPFFLSASLFLACPHIHGTLRHGTFHLLRQLEKAATQPNSSTSPSDDNTPLLCCSSLLHFAPACFFLSSLPLLFLSNFCFHTHTQTYPIIPQKQITIPLLSFPIPISSFATRSFFLC